MIWASLDPSSTVFVTAKSRPKTAPGLSGPGCFSLDHKKSWNEKFSKRTLTAVIFDQMAPAKICLLDLNHFSFPFFDTLARIVRIDGYDLIQILNRRIGEN